MEHDQAGKYVTELYAHLLRRTPQPEERESWIATLMAGMSAEAVFHEFIRCPEYQGIMQVRPAFPDGHFHSPVVDPATVRADVRSGRAASKLGIAGIDLPIAGMAEFWSRYAEFIRRTPFTEAPDAARRYYYDNPVFSYGDAITLRAMLEAFRPRRVIEIGSGFSSACMLDTADEIGLADLELTCIDPDPDRLRRLLRPEDHRHVTIVAHRVQSVPVESFKSLAENDILFIDSTHVLKTGSDVHYELFEILPSLRSGVIVQFHDMHYPFEYPDDWIFNLKFSWNEIYAVRAFLMYNANFPILFWNSFFATAFPDVVGGTIPDFLKNPGGSLWLRRA